MPENELILKKSSGYILILNEQYCTTSYYYQNIIKYSLVTFLLDYYSSVSKVFNKCICTVLLCSCLTVHFKPFLKGNWNYILVLSFHRAYMHCITFLWFSRTRNRSLNNVKIQPNRFWKQSNTLHIAYSHYANEKQK